MITNQSDSRVIICQAQYQEIITQERKSPITTGQAAINLSNNKILNPNGFSSLPNTESNFDKANVSSVVVDKIYNLPYVKKKTPNSDKTKYYIWLENKASDLPNIQEIKINNTTIRDTQYLSIGDDLLIRCEPQVLKELNTAVVVKAYASDITTYGWVYDLDNLTQDELLSYPSMDIFDFSISEDNATIIENGSFHEVSARDVIEQNYKISFTEYDSDSATYNILSTNPTSSKYAIFRITTLEDEVIIDKYYDCVLQNYNKSEGTDVNRYTYDFSCKY